MCSVTYRCAPSDEKTQEPIITDEPTLKNPESSEETIRRVLSGYDIGAKLRRLRLRKKIALVDLGKHTGLSASMLSQLENGKLIPTLPTLARIAMVFDVGLEHFFGKTSKRVFSIVRANERLRLPKDSDSPAPGYSFEILALGSMERNMSAYLAEFPKHDPPEAREHSQEGAEFLFVLEGSLAIHYQAEEHVLGAGDSMYFDGSEPHSYSGLSESPARAIIVTVPLRL